MLIVLIEEARAGMKLAADMVHPSQPDQVLLRRGFILDAVIIDKMRHLGILAIYVDYPGLQDIDRHLLPTLSPERARIYGQVKGTVAAVQRTAQPTVGFGDYYAAIRVFILTLFQQGDHPLYLEQIALRQGDQGVAHASAVAHLSLMLGLRLQSYLLEERKRLPAQHATEVVNLGIAGMLHDIGKCKLPPQAAEFCSGREPPADLRASWESHPSVGFEMVRGGVESSAAAAILYHHRRFDGEGFPAVFRKNAPVPLAQHDLHVFARILHAANLFDRLTHGSESAGTHRPAYQVFHQIRTYYAGALDPVVFAALQQTVPPFPPGGWVHLSDGTLAVVTGFSRDPYRPLVRRCIGDRWHLENQVLNLSQPGAPAIDAVDGIKVGRYLPPPEPPRATARAKHLSELPVSSS